ncbi:MAG: transcriptional regulator [Polyangiales bacterium]
MRERPPKPPPARAVTPRDALREALLTTRDTGATASARELASAAGLTEKDVIHHLEHLARSLPHEALKLVVEPATCLACEYVFRDRDRLTAPSACPECRSERVAPPSFKVADGPRVTKHKHPARHADDDGGDDEA